MALGWEWFDMGGWNPAYQMEDALQAIVQHTGSNFQEATGAS
jgi:hypothetical protein